MNKHKKRKVRYDRLALVCAFLLLLIASVFSIGKYTYNLLMNRDKVVIADVYDPNVPMKFGDLLTTDKYLLSRVRVDDNYVVAANREDEKIYPASLTKLMVLKVAVDYIDDFDYMMRVNYRDLEGLLDNNASVLGLQVNDEISLLNLLYGLILPSGADCGNVLNRYFAEQDLDLLALMNEEAQELGMSNTHFSNTSGLYDEDNYTTLTDLNLLGVALLKNDIAKEVLETYYRTDDGFVFRSTARDYEDKLVNGGVAILGGKTGYIPESGLNYFAIIKDSKGQISLLFLSGCDNESEYGRYAHFEDAIKVMKNYFE